MKYSMRLFFSLFSLSTVQSEHLLIKKYSISHIVTPTQRQLQQHLQNTPLAVQDPSAPPAEHMGDPADQSTENNEKYLSNLFKKQDAENFINSTRALKAYVGHLARQGSTIALSQITFGPEAQVMIGGQD
jgi:hypothetical protein